MGLPLRCWRVCKVQGIGYFRKMCDSRFSTYKWSKVYAVMRSAIRSPIWVVPTFVQASE